MNLSTSLFLINKGFTQEFSRMSGFDPIVSAKNLLSLLNEKDREIQEISIVSPELAP